jgi:hypothetical protein
MTGIPTVPLTRHLSGFSLLRQPLGQVPVRRRPAVLYRTSDILADIEPAQLVVVCDETARRSPTDGQREPAKRRWTRSCSRAGPRLETRSSAPNSPQAPAKRRAYSLVIVSANSGMAERIGIWECRDPAQQSSVGAIDPLRSRVLNHPPRRQPVGASEGFLCWQAAPADATVHCRATQGPEVNGWPRAAWRVRPSPSDRRPRPDG